jgi:hypothetical protein
MAYGPEVKSREERHGGKDLPGYENSGEREAPPIDSLIVKPRS